MSENEVRIKVRESGPYVITGNVTLVDADGNTYETANPKGNIALCRCGGSTTKPFCDGTHGTTGFQAAERAVRAADEVAQ